MVGTALMFVKNLSTSPDHDKVTRLVLLLNARVNEGLLFDKSPVRTPGAQERYGCHPSHSIS